MVMIIFFSSNPQEAKLLTETSIQETERLFFLWGIRYFVGAFGFYYQEFNMARTDSHSQSARPLQEFYTFSPGIAGSSQYFLLDHSPLAQLLLNSLVPRRLQEL
ncbi:unnamed protein product [Allacma fusca]|uniref:Uncharacterized protein n=1 Tax=Allacma fusca TaxID=39272 RepID=A0A8J2KMZ5_9HEXA|nr:unnamed protein product [Allacma fusca]